MFSGRTAVTTLTPQLADVDKKQDLYGTLCGKKKMPKKISTRRLKLND